MTFDVLVVLGFNGMMSSTSSVTVGVDVTEASGGVVVITIIIINLLNGHHWHLCTDFVG